MTRGQKIKIRRLVNSGAMKALRENDDLYYLVRDQVHELVEEIPALEGCDEEEAVDYFNKCIDEAIKKWHFKMKVKGGRSFQYRGEKYLVQDLCGGDKTDGKKYCVNVWKDECWNPCHDILGLALMRFKSINEARRYVRDNYYLLTIL